MMSKAVALTIRIKKNDRVGGKRLWRAILDYLIEAGVSGATVWTGVDGFGKRGRSEVKIEGVSVNMPLVIEVIEERARLEPLLGCIKQMVGDNGLVTLHDADIL